MHNTEFCFCLLMLLLLLFLLFVPSSIGHMCFCTTLLSLREQIISIQCMYKYVVACTFRHTLPVIISIKVS